MSATETRQDKLARLATRICAGEVVFFIGAGFSLDSEGNTTGLLIARLLARFEAMTLLLQHSADLETARTARRLRQGLRVTFALGDQPQETPIDIFDTTKKLPDGRTQLEAAIASLVPNYYVINDWMCSAFDSLIVCLARTRPPAFEADLAATEADLLRRYSAAARLDAMDVAWYVDLQRHVDARPGPSWERSVAGKALFLDTLGFNSSQVMAGKPLDADLDVVLEHSTRLRPRHHVLAWLAAEGLCAALVTTNYDMLIDSAYRLAGMQPLRPDVRLWTATEAPLDRAQRMRLPLNRRYRHFTRIAQATQFFTHGDAHESAVIHKIHGCVETYRLARAARDAEQVRKILPSIVFTFREIQNWREDSWSRDHLATLMRTRTIVFAGYSGADQVIHDTFRTVYEQIGDYRSEAADDQQHSSAAPHDEGSHARAFFTDRANVNSFHGLEILRAASAAAGDPSSDLTDHVNLLTFYVRDAQFPTIDDTFTWIYHLVARELQAQALEAEVGRIGYQLFDRRCPEEEIHGMIESFRRLRAHEIRQARRFDAAGMGRPARDVRRWLDGMTRWTTVFGAALMREYQIAESLLRYPTDTFQIRAAAQYPWYRPLSEHPQWTAWGVILELALRRAIAWQIDRPALWLRPSSAIEVVTSPQPTVAFPASPIRGRGLEPPVRRSVTIELATFWRRFVRADERRFAARAPVIWELQPETVPWWTHADKGRPAGTPEASTIWQWAAFEPSAWANADPTPYLGGSALGEQQSA